MVGNGTVYRYLDSNAVRAMKWLMDQSIEVKKTMRQERLGRPQIRRCGGLKALWERKLA